MEIKFTKKNARQVFDNILNRMKEDSNDCKVYEEEINNVLDFLLGEDFFGTEGQLDPRGDHRDLDQVSYRREPNKKKGKK
jgi:hypothetical protein